MLHGLSLLSVGLWLMISQAWNIYTIMSARVLLGFISSTSSSASKSVPGANINYFFVAPLVPGTPSSPLLAGYGHEL